MQNQNSTVTGKIPSWPGLLTHTYVLYLALIQGTITVMFYSLVLIVSVAAFQLCSLLRLCIVPWIVQNNVSIVVYEDMCPKNMQHCFFPGAGKELYQDCLLTIMSLEISILSSLWKNICYFYHHVKPGFTFFIFIFYQICFIDTFQTLIIRTYYT